MEFMDKQAHGENQKLLLKPSAAAKLIDVSRSKIYELMSTGAIPCVRLDGSRLLRIPYAAIQRIIDRAIASAGEPDAR
jgi:excisionase family DNA binding protein